VLPGRCVAERKTAADLISSLFDGIVCELMNTLHVFEEDDVSLHADIE